MGSVTSLFKLGVRFTLAATLLVGCFVAAIVQVYAATTTVQIYGTVYNAQGVSLENVSVYATATGGNDTLYGPVTTDSNGAYTFEVAYKASYDIHFIPDAGTSGLQSYTEANFSVVRANRQLDAYLETSQTHTFSGIVRDAANTPAEGIEVRTESEAGGSETAVTDSNGFFSIVRSNDVYAVTLAKTDTAALAAYPSFILPQNTVDLTAGDVSQDYQLPALGQAIVTAHDRFGDVAANQEISFSVGDSESYTAVTDAQGIATVPFLLNTAIPAGSICSTFVLTEATVCNNDAYDGTAGISLTLDAPMKSILSGTVTDNDGQPVGDIHVALTADADGTVLNATTGPDGGYAVVADPGTYAAAVTTIGSTKTVTKHWSVFTLDEGGVNLATDAVRNYTLPAIRNLQVTVSGSTDNTVRLDIDSDDGGYFQAIPHFDTTANFVALEGQTIPAGTLCITYNSSNAPSECNTSDITVGASDPSYAFTAPEMYTLSGQILNADGTPAKGIGAKLQIAPGVYAQAVGKTATYSIRLMPGTYNVLLLAGSVSEDQGTINIVDTDVTQNYQLSE